MCVTVCGCVCVCLWGWPTKGFWSAQTLILLMIHSLMFVINLHQYHKSESKYSGQGLHQDVPQATEGGLKCHTRVLKNLHTMDSTQTYHITGNFLRWKRSRKTAHESSLPPPRIFGGTIHISRVRRDIVSYQFANILTLESFQRGMV